MAPGAVTLYRALLRQSRAFFDPLLAHQFSERVRARFRDSPPQGQPRWVRNRLNDARRQLRLLVRANAGEIRALRRVLSAGLGLRGYLKHRVHELRLAKTYRPSGADLSGLDALQTVRVLESEAAFLAAVERRAREWPSAGQQALEFETGIEIAPDDALSPEWAAERLARRKAQERLRRRALAEANAAERAAIGNARAANRAP